MNMLILFFKSISLILKENILSRSFPPPQYSTNFWSFHQENLWEEGLREENGKNNIPPPNFFIPPPPQAFTSLVVCCHGTWTPWESDLYSAFSRCYLFGLQLWFLSRVACIVLRVTLVDILVLSIVVDAWYYFDSLRVLILQPWNLCNTLLVPLSFYLNVQYLLLIWRCVSPFSCQDLLFCVTS